MKVDQRASDISAVEEALGGLFLKASGATFLVKVAGAGIAFIAQVFLARFMGASGYGIYVFVLSWVGVLGLFSKCGFDLVVVRYGAAYRKALDWGRLSGLYRRAAQVPLVVSMGLAGGAAVSFQIWSKGEWINYSSTVIIASILLVVVTLTAIRQAILQSLHHVVRAQVPDEVVRPAFLLIFSFSATLFVKGPLPPEWAMISNLVAAAMAFLLGGYLLLQVLPKNVAKALPVFATGEWIRAAVPLLFISAMHLVLSQSDLIMIGLMLSSESTGVYGAAARIAGVVSFGIVSVNAVMAPMISAQYSAGNYKALQSLATLSARTVFGFTVAAATVIGVMAEFVLGIFGDEFQTGETALRILLFSQVANAVTGSVGYLMTMTGHQRQAAWIVGGTASLNVLLNFMLIPLYGIEGGALATAISTVIWNVIMFRYVRKKLDINSTIVGGRNKPCVNRIS